MKKNILDALKTISLIVVLMILTGMINGLPWWSFVIPVSILGVIISYRKWNVPGFAVGFIAGFMVWLMANLYFDITLGGTILNKMALLLSLSKITLLLFSGIIGGVLTGLALYTGKSIVSERKIQSPV
jgi:hypothetical protein